MKKILIICLCLSLSNLVAQVNIGNNDATIDVNGNMSIKGVYQVNGVPIGTIGATGATGGTFTIKVGTQTTGNIAYDANSVTMAGNIKTAIDALSNVTAVTVTSVVAQKEFSILYTTANEGWETHTANIASLTSVTSYYFRAKCGYQN